jgi:hypothetical protein
MVHELRRAKLTFPDGQMVQQVIGINVPIISVLKGWAGNDRIWVKMGLESGGQTFDVVGLANDHVDSHLRKTFKIMYNNTDTGTSVEFI